MAEWPKSARLIGSSITRLDGMAKAIATFERTALSGDSAYDKYNTDGDAKAIDESAKRGMVLFGLRLIDDDPDKEKIEKAVTLKKANCTSCHIGFNFTDERTMASSWLTFIFTCAGSRVKQANNKQIRRIGYPFWAKRWRRKRSSAD